MQQTYTIKNVHIVGNKSFGYALSHLTVQELGYKATPAPMTP